jgi:hypothetical protein
VGQKINHKKYGTGEVKKVLNHNKIIVAFGAEEKQFAQNQPVEPPEPPVGSPMSADGGAVTPPPTPAPTFPSPGTPG